MKKDKARVLFVSYYFPPSGGSGVLRIIRFVKYMKHFERHPFVLTIDERDIWKLGYGTTTVDDSYSKVGNMVDVRRVRIARPSNFVLSMLKYLKKSFSAIASMGKRCAVNKDESGNAKKETGHLSEAKDIKSYYSSDSNPFLKLFFELVLIFDQIIEWGPRAIWHGLQYIRRNRIGIICSSSPPWSVHLVGYVLKLFYHARWIMDLRDPMFGIEMKGFSTRESSWPIRIFYRMLESIFVRGADVVVCNCQEIKEYYEDKYSKSRFEVILNSFDPDDFDEMMPEDNGREKFIISHFGALYPTIRTPDAFLKAFSSALDKNLFDRDTVELHFYGAADYVNTKSFQNLIRVLDISSMVECHDYIKHDIVLQKMVSADLLLLLQPHDSTNYQIPAKLYEYIAAGRPLLAVAPNGSATSRLIKEYDLGLVCDPTDIPALKSGIIAALNGELLLPDESVVEQFSASHMTRRLAKIIDSLH